MKRETMIDFSTAIRAAFEGGREILDVYDSDFAVETKDDKTPLTLADKRAHHKIVDVLAKTSLPVLSEEGKAIPYATRAAWPEFWMVDPLDGTKEFVKRNGEFTVNIALIKDGKASFGVIFVPVKNQLFFGGVGEGAYLIEDFVGDTFAIEDLRKRGHELPMPKSGNGYVAVGSRSHMSPETEAFFEELRGRHGDIEVVSMGSSLKICLVAQGVADIYPRFAPTMEWDTAAGHAIAKGAGKNIIDYTTQAEMRYNKENLLNNWFVVK